MSFLNEAFQELNLMESEDFSLDKKGIDGLKDFIETDDNVDFVNVIDPEAETTEECEGKPHVGMAILCCDVCNSLHYEEPQDIVIDEETQKANVGICCPFCFSTEGFSIVGTVAPYEEVEVKVDGETPKEVKVDNKEVEIKDEIKEEWQPKLNLWLKKDGKWLLSGPLHVDTVDEKGKNELKFAYSIIGYEDVKVLPVGENAPTDSVNESLKSLRNGKKALKESWKPSLVLWVKQVDEWKPWGALSVDSVTDADKDELRRAFKKLGYSDISVVANDGSKPSEELKEDSYLAPKFDSRASFYNKATISDDGKTLYSYGTKVIEIVDGKPVLRVGENLLSTTTLRHIKEFLKQKGFKAESKQQILRDYSPVDECLKESKESADTLTDEEIYQMFMDKLVGSQDQVTRDSSGKSISPRYTKGPYTIDDVLVEQNSQGIDCIAVKASNREALKKAIDIAKYYDALYEVKQYSRQDSHKKYGVLIDYGSADLEKLLADDGKVFDMKKKGEKLEDSQKYPVNSPLPAQTGLKKNGKLDLSKTYAGDPNKSEILTENKSVKEGMEDIRIKTDDQVITVTSKPVEGKEAIVPPKKDDFEDIDVEEIDQDSFDELGESYLKRVYENVNSFKTINGKIDGNKIILEGLIKFNSGKKAKTSFILEAKEITKRGNARFIGMNEGISKNRKAYLITGKIKDKKLMLENFNFNYTGKDSVTGKSKKLYGTVRRSK